MKLHLQAITTLTKDKIIRNRFLVLKISCILIVAFLTAGMFTDSAQAATGLRIYNYATKKESIYKDKQIKVTLNGTTIGRTQTPGILVKGIALVPYNDIFEKSDIAAECVYNKSEGTISISKYGKSIKMTIGSTKAIVNGKKVTLPIAPMKIKYVDVNMAKVLVPSRFISETLGLGYTWSSSKSTVAIEKSTMLLSYNSGSKFEYAGIQGKVTIDGKKVDLGNMPSIITNNTAMLRASKVFTNSAIGASYSYNKKDKTVTLSKGDKVLVMTLGSTTAYLNNNALKLDTAPIIVKNYDIDSSYVMVPGGFTASCLGFDYTWNNTSRTSMITANKAETSETVNNSGSDTDPELGDNGVITEVGTILNQWTGNDTLYSRSNNIHEVNSSLPPSVNPGMIYSVSRDYTNMKQNTETFVLSGSGSFGKVTAKNTDKKITINASGMSCTDQTYQMYGISSAYVNTIGIYNNDTNQSATIELDLLSADYTYDIKLSEDMQSLYVTVYYNSMISTVIGTNSVGDYITLTGINPISVTTNKTNGFIYIDLPGTTNALGDLNTSIVGSKYITMFYAIGASDRTQLIIGVNEGYEYYISENDNQYTMLFQIPGVVGQPSVPSSEQPNIPGVIDQSKYEIIIPKPAGLTSAMVTDEDNYYDNNFVIKLAGDYTSMINNYNVRNTSSVVDNVSISLNSNYQTEILIETSKLQGYEYVMDDTNIYVNIGNPRDIYPNIVVLDPGHGGGANGCQYFGMKEKDINLHILYTLGQKYFNQNPSKLKVYYIRKSDVDMYIGERAAFAKKYGADLFVSLHMNASLSKSAYGTEIYYSSNNNKPNSAGLTSKILADMFLNNITSNLSTKNRGSRSEKYTVVYKNTVPAVLIELGFLSNASDFALISDSAFQENAAETIYETILQVFNEYPTGR